MNYDKLFELGKPATYVVIIDDGSFANLCGQLRSDHPASVIRMIRGKKSKTVLAFLDEVSAALQFPYYFGENSAAFDECITDLDWITGDAYLLMVSNADYFLSETSSEQFNGWIHSLSRASEEWLTPNKYIPRNREPTPFHVLFQCGEPCSSTFLRRLEDSDVEFDRLD
jgi:hypothetical protein